MTTNADRRDSAVTADESHAGWRDLADAFDDLEPGDLDTIDEPAPDVHAGAPPSFSRAVALALMVGAVFSAALLSGCAWLAAHAPEIEAIDAAACDGIVSILVPGEVSAIACKGEEQLVKAALDADIAAHPPTSALPVSAAEAATVVRPKVTRRSGRGRAHVGYFPPSRAARCQAWIDALSPMLDASAPDARSFVALPALGLVPFADASDLGSDAGP